MRITLTTHQFLPEHASGTEILTLHSALELHRRGHDVRVFTGFPAKVHLKDSERFDTYEYKGIPVHRFLHQHVPMGEQSNIVEMEYNNHLFGEHFRSFLRENPQDIVHFFHLSRLTATAIDACSETGTSMAFTATDFWSLCPTSQLRLHDGSLCSGPDAFAHNCVRHLVEVSQPEEVRSRLRVLPDAIVAAGIIAIQNDMLPERWYSSFVRAISSRPEFIRQRLNKIDRILVPTRLMQRLLAKNGVHPSRQRFVPYGVDLQHIARNIEKGNAPLLRIGFIGTLYEHKGAHLLIQALKSLSNQIPVELKIFGNLNEFPAYVSELRTLAGDDARIRFMGTFPNEEIGQVLQGLDVLVVPSIWYENTPLVIYSAMAAGCPVIATDLGGMSEAVTNGVNGLLFEKGNCSQLAGHIQSLAEDRGTLRRFAASTRMPKSIPHYVDELEVVYSEIKGSSIIPGGGVKPNELATKDTRPL